jgi:hypothetical protein
MTCKEEYRLICGDMESIFFVSVFTVKSKYSD